MEKSLKILLADDHPLFREGLKSVLLKLTDQVTVIEAEDYPGVFEAAGRDDDLDLVLLDLYMPGMPGMDGIRHFRQRHPELALVVMSAANEPEDIQRIMASGALGYITKSTSPERILGALRQVLAGGIYMPFSRQEEPPASFPIDPNQKLATLTQRQLSVLKALVSGKSNHQIAELLQVAEGTVKTHLNTIFRILGVHNRTEAVLTAQRLGIRD
jgi:DNA-binding NarL/FixJ family response regulator